MPIVLETTMRIRPTTRSSVSTLAVLGVVLGVAGPPASANALVATPEHRPASGRVGLALEVVEDGRGPFTPNDEPGGDASGSNGVVRTLDAITYRVTMNSTDGASSNERFTLTAPTGTRWAGVPATCTGPGSTIDDRDLVCNLGTVAEGQAVAVPAVLTVSGDLHHGDRITVSATGTADDAGGADVTAVSPPTVVSAAARYNLSKNIVGSQLRTDVTGPDGATKGVQLVYPIAVDWEPVVAGQGLLGFERSSGRMTFRDDVSEILGALPADARLWNGGAPACGVNALTDWRFSQLPGGRGGTANSVVDSGTIDCAQPAPGAPVDVTITGAVTDPTHLPSEGIAGALVTNDRAYVVSGYLSLWMPTPPDNTSVESKNVYSALQTTSTGGAQNFPGGTEPLGDNTATRNLVELLPGGVGKVIARPLEGGSVGAGSAKDGDPWITPGQQVRSHVTATNNGLGAWSNAVLCDTFDRHTQRLSTINGVAAWTSRFPGARVQFAAYDMADPAEGQQHECGDADGPWFDTPEAVPGGADAVGAVRAVGDVRGGAAVNLFAAMEIRDAPNGTRARDFGHASLGDRDPRWIHDDHDPSLGAGRLADSVLVTENLARVTKKVIDPGHDASDTPDETSVAVAGSTVDYALYPSLTNGNAAGKPTEVTVRDVLPLHSTFVAGSASTTPTAVDTVADADGQEHQRLVWRLTDVAPNTTIAPLTYTVAVSGIAPAGSLRNQVTIESPTDKSDLAYRNAVRAVQVVTPGGIGVEKTAINPVVVDGDRLEWSLGYTNTDGEAAHDVDLIDVLPHQGDGNGSAFHGSVGLAEPVRIDAGADERVVYTAATPSTIAFDGDDPSNQPGGSTTWCAEAELGTAGCPATLAEVTAVRVLRGAPVAPGAVVMHRVSLATTGASDQDTYTNRFGLRASNLALPVQSNPATIRVVSGSIGDRVWADDDADGLQDDDEPGVGGVPVHLGGTDDRGADVVRDTRTDADGRYRFDGLRPGAYVVTFTAPDGRGFTAEHAGTDGALDSDADPAGRTATVDLSTEVSEVGALDGVQRLTTIDAGVLPGAPVDPVGPGVPGDDGASGSGHPSGTGAAGDAGAHPAPVSDGDRGAGARGALAFTGTQGLELLTAGAVLLLLLGLLLVGARRHTLRGHARRGR
ncbi:SdrD B-like domain-containing protein [Curtobacterium sp. ISL-83]|uniref:SdrD B-like domain-containing protein n=1 Tax=Curtobacterium sp. ISL-83 TaxID=2819145 RepID=UPI001BEB7D72|nr:SdrD B-like domain-containing protein [Curtobacterium sp. ISL-83]MBT2502671.1 carboxypeptidase regulatory-like domain-containing protein [Curtobacterium sp. ISL-83]